MSRPVGTAFTRNGMRRLVAKVSQATYDKWCAACRREGIGSGKRLEKVIQESLRRGVRVTK